ncbi:Hint domain-containing protein [Marivivens donghaensis]|uniref:Hint domain-containing protein n=1 Tax=Marivivens donghaensis TaxID=1699413 RepID=A0ABX0VWV3_9RHOB|nr:Hint domain-containing protein [Marivivens donghaensis]NIY72563.1 Hint domain-containing protein [Marivivens donghaensis]
MPKTPEPNTSQTLPVFRAEEFVVVNGVAEGDSLSFADELLMDDIYQLAHSAQRSMLTVVYSADGKILTIDGQSETGGAGNRIFLDCMLTLMGSDSHTHEAVVLVEVEDDEVEAIYLLPLSKMVPDTEYRLVGIDRNAALPRFAEMACVSFARGTRITMASGEQRPIEDLKVGDRLLTRDDGAQQIRWVGQTTLRATGQFAPVLIRKGALNNANDLLLSPEHRLFVYQRQDQVGAGRAEVLVKVRHLINGDSVVQQDGGYVDYFQLLFDDHQIIYAEGIAAESLMIDPRTRAALPNEIRSLGHKHRHHLDYEIEEELMKDAKAVERLRKASST